MDRITLDISDKDLIDTRINAYTDYIISIAEKIKQNAGNLSYYKEKEIPHGELQAEFNSDIDELYKMYLIMANFI